MPINAPFVAFFEDPACPGILLIEVTFWRPATVTFFVNACYISVFL